MPMKRNADNPVHCLHLLAPTIINGIILANGKLRALPTNHHQDIMIAMIPQLSLDI
jgi:hypothetical protein